MNLLFAEVANATPNEMVLKTITVVSCIVIFVLLLMKQNQKSTQ